MTPQVITMCPQGCLVGTYSFTCSSRPQIFIEDLLYVRPCSTQLTFGGRWTSISYTAGHAEPKADWPGAAETGGLSEEGRGGQDPPCRRPGECRWVGVQCGGGSGTHRTACAEQRGGRPGGGSGAGGQGQTGPDELGEQSRREPQAGALGVCFGLVFR